MNILVGINHYDYPGGSETFTYTFINELVKKGHQVELYVHVRITKNIMLNETKKLGVEVHNNVPSKEYDMIFISHTSVASALQNKQGVKIQICHGIYFQLEQPVSFVDMHISISDEVKRHLRTKGYNSKLIYNSVDCGRFRPINAINDKLTTVLSLIQGDEANKMAMEACEELGINFIYFNKFRKPTFRIENEINKADLVLTIGRGAFESMACGRNVVLFDQRAYATNLAIGDGMIESEEAALEFAMNNLSGRYSNRFFGKNELKFELLKYNREYGDMCRQIALKYFNMEQNIDEYLNI